VRTLALQPIPGFEAAVVDVVRALGDSAGRVVGLRAGVVCPTPAAGEVGRALHARVLACLQL
jgi:hypothetical protein